MDAMQIISSSITLAQDISKLISAAGSLELKEKILELREQLVTTKTTLVDLIEENRQLRDEIKRLSNPPELKPGKDGGYYKADGDGPFCPKCFDVDRLTVRLREETGPFSVFGKWECPHCKTHLGESI